MTDKVLKMLLTAAAHQRQGRMTRAAQLFTLAANSEDFPRLLGRLSRGAMASEKATAEPKSWPFKQTASQTPGWPFKQRAANNVRAEVEDLDEDELVMLEDDDMVSSGIEDDFIDMGLSDDLDEAVLELSAAEDDSEEEDESDDSKEEEKQESQAASFARICSNIQAIHAAAKKKAKTKKAKRTIKK